MRVLLTLLLLLFCWSDAFAIGEIGIIGWYHKVATSTGPNTVILRPTAIAYVYDWPVTGAPTKVEAVDDVTSDGDTSYIQEVSTGRRAQFTYSQITGCTSVTSVTLYASMKGDDNDGDVSFVMYGAGGSNYSSNKAISTSYSLISWDMADNPDTGTTWTCSEVNALNAGIRSDASAFTYQRISQIYAEVVYE